MKFDEMNISEKLIKATKDMGFEEASPIQAQAIPYILEGKDIIGQAQTGTGKTAAFGIPVLQQVDTKTKHVQALIVCPTRELAIQISDELHKLSKYMHSVKILPIYGGQDIVRQIKALKAGVQIVIGTPGRIMDHMRRKTVNFSNVKTIILDEADEMLNMGFREDIETILQNLSEERQTVLFSATMPKPIQDIAKNYQKDAAHIQIAHKELTVENIEQYYYDVRPSKKEEVLTRLIDSYNPKLSIVFCNTKQRTEEVAEYLKSQGYYAEALHGDLKQTQRDRVMNAFRKGRTDILVATDVAARGIDVDNVDVVFNYDLPQDDEYYVHRIGRTGRAGKSGIALSFVVAKEVYKMREIAKYCKTKINLKPIPSLNEIKNARTEKIFETLTNILEASDLADMREAISNRINEYDLTPMDIAAALLRLTLGADESDDLETLSIDRALENTGANEGMVKLFINIGKKNNVRPGDIVGAIAGESKIQGRLIGSIKVYDAYTFVEVPKDQAKKVIAAMKNAKIKGKSICVEPANAK